jgi:gliding motility-associated protein GldL
MEEFMAKLYGIGASIVIIGALFKIQHWPFAGNMLTVGLFTESIIFFFSAFEPLHEEVEWTLVYPELAGIPEEEPGVSRAVGSGKYSGAGSGGFGGGEEALLPFQNSMNCLKSRHHSRPLRELGIGMKKLSETASNFNVMGDVTAASTRYIVQ